MTLTSIETWFFVFLITLITLPFLAPLFSYWGWDAPARIIYFLYSFTCHQFHHRSYHIHDEQCAWCARDTGIWIGFTAAAVCHKFGFIKKIRWWIVPLFALPMLLDGGIQTLATLEAFQPNGSVGELTYASSNFSRFITGSIFGVGLSLWISPMILTQNSNFYQRFQNWFLNTHATIRKFWTLIFRNQATRLLTLFIMLIFVHIIIIFIWNITSNEYKPANFLDTEPRVQEGYFFERRVNGPCPTTETSDIFDVECLLGKQ